MTEGKQGAGKKQWEKTVDFVFTDGKDRDIMHSNYHIVPAAAASTRRMEWGEKPRESVTVMLPWRR